MDQAARAVKAVVMRFLELAPILLLEEERGRVLEMGTSAAGIGAAANPEASSSRGRWHHSRVGRTGRHQAHSRVEVVGGG